MTHVSNETLKIPRDSGCQSRRLANRNASTSIIETIGSTRISLAFLCGLLLLNGCSVVGGIKVEDQLMQTFDVASIPSVEVKTFNGRVEVVKGEPGKVVCEVTRYARGKTEEAALNRVEEVLVSMTQEQDAVIVTAQSEKKIANGLGASVLVRVPEGGNVRLSSSNGRIFVSETNGSVAAKTSNGRIEVISTQGLLSLKSSNGPISITSSSGVVDAETSNGAIEYEGALSPGQHRFETSNGPIKLWIPPSSAIALDAKTSNGKVTTDLINQSNPGTFLKAEFGENPETTVELRTSNGSIQVMGLR